MKKLLAALTVSACLCAAPAFACTQAEASAMLTSILTSPQYAALSASVKTKEDADHVVAINTRMGEAANYYTRQELDEACKVYAEIQKTIGIDGTADPVPSLNDAALAEGAAAAAAESAAKAAATPATDVPATPAP